MKSSKDIGTCGGCCAIEIDAVALDLIQIYFEVVRDVAETLGEGLSLPAFFRNIFGLSIEPALARLAQPTGKAAPSAQAVRDAVAARLMEATMPDGAIAAINDLVGHGVEVVLLTRLDASRAAATFAGLLATSGVSVVSDSPASIGARRHESWVSLAQRGAQDRRLCAVVGSAISCKGALAAGFTPIACASKITAYQDYVGAYDSFIGFDQDVVPTILSALHMA